MTSFVTGYVTHVRLLQVGGIYMEIPMQPGT